MNQIQITYTARFGFKFYYYYFYVTASRKFSKDFSSHRDPYTI